MLDSPIVQRLASLDHLSKLHIDSPKSAPNKRYVSGPEGSFLARHRGSHPWRT